MPRFRIDPCEDRLLPEPEVTTYETLDRRGDLVFASGLQHRPIEPELFIRRVPVVDVDDLDDVIAFSACHGLLKLPHAMMSLLEAPPWSVRGIDVSRWDDERHRGAHEGADVVHHVDSLSLAASMMRSLVRSWASSMDGEPAAPNWSWIGARVSEEKAAAVAAFTMNQLLRPVAPQVQVAVSGRYQALINPDPVDLSAAIAVQLYNAMVEGIQVRRCAHCGTEFIRQQGRAAHGQFRTKGVLYCSSRCAKAASDRAHRQRKKESAP